MSDIVNNIINNGFKPVFVLTNEKGEHKGREWSREEVNNFLISEERIKYQNIAVLCRSDTSIWALDIDDDELMTIPIINLILNENTIKKKSGRRGITLFFRFLSAKDLKNYNDALSQLNNLFDSKGIAIDVLYNHHSVIPPSSFIDNNKLYTYSYCSEMTFENTHIDELPEFNEDYYKLLTQYFSQYPDVESDNRVKSKGLEKKHGRNNKLSSMIFAMHKKGKSLDVIKNEVTTYDAINHNPPYLTDSGEMHRGNGQKWIEDCVKRIVKKGVKPDYDLIIYAPNLAEVSAMTTHVTAETDEVIEQVDEEALKEFTELKEIPLPPEHGLINDIYEFMEFDLNYTTNNSFIMYALSLNMYFAFDKMFHEGLGNKTLTNHMIINIATSSEGKSALWKSVNKALTPLHRTIPESCNASIQIIQEQLLENRNLYSFKDEIQNELISDKNYQWSVIKTLNRLYTCAESFYTPIKSMSKKDAMNKVIYEPNYSFFGTTTQADSADILSKSFITNGLMGRVMLVVNNEKKRNPYSNEMRYGNNDKLNKLINKFKERLGHSILDLNDDYKIIPPKSRIDVSTLESCDYLQNITFKHEKLSNDTPETMRYMLSKKAEQVCRMATGYCYSVNKEKMTIPMLEWAEQVFDTNVFNFHQLKNQLMHTSQVNKIQIKLLNYLVSYKEKTITKSVLLNRTRTSQDNILIIDLALKSLLSREALIELDEKTHKNTANYLLNKQNIVDHLRQLKGGV